LAQFFETRCSCSLNYTDTLITQNITNAYIIHVFYSIGRLRNWVFSRSYCYI